MTNGIWPDSGAITAKGPDRHSWPKNIQMTRQILLRWSQQLLRRLTADQRSPSRHSWVLRSLVGQVTTQVWQMLQKRRRLAASGPSGSQESFRSSGKSFRRPKERRPQGIRASPGGRGRGRLRWPSQVFFFYIIPLLKTSKQV